MVHADPPQSSNRNELPPQITAETQQDVQVSVSVCFQLMSEPTKLWPSIDLFPCKLSVLHRVIPQKR